MHSNSTIRNCKLPLPLIWFNFTHFLLILKVAELMSIKYTSGHVFLHLKNSPQLLMALEKSPERHWMSFTDWLECTLCPQHLLLYSVHSKIVSGDFPGGPVVNNLPPNARDAGSVPSEGTKIPHTLEQLSLYPTTTEVHMLWSPKATTRGFTCHSWRSHMTHKDRINCN